jgi:hypothetical protein
VITSRSYEVVKILQVYSEDILNVGSIEVKVAGTLLLKKLKKVEQKTSLSDIKRLVEHLDNMLLIQFYVTSLRLEN